MKGIHLFLLVIAAGYLALCGVIYTQQEKFLFHPTKLPADFQYQFTHPFVEINFAVPGAMINAVHFKAEQPKGVILYLHGNGDIVSRLEEVAAYFLSLHYDVLMPDYRGYGKSSGAITNEADFYNDMRVVYAYVQERYSEDQIILYGQSMGSGVAAQLAAAKQPSRLILESPYYSMRDMARIRMPWAPPFLLKYQLRTDRWIQQVRCPIDLIHGTADGVIPYHASERLYQLIQGKKEFLTVPGGGHSSLLWDTQVRAFLEQQL